MTNPQAGTAATVQGPMNAVPCPHCGKKQDFRMLNEQQLLDRGHEVICDHCGFSQEVVAIQQITFIAVRKNPRFQGRPPQGPGAPAPARAVSPGFVQKLLGRGRGRR